MYGLDSSSQLAGLVVFALLTAAGTAQVGAVSPLTLQAGGLVAEPAVIDFGERGHLETPQTRLSLANRSGQPIRIQQLRPSCSCIRLKPATWPTPIAAGESVIVEVSMGSGRAMGTLSKHIDIQTDRGSVRVPTRMSVFDGFRVEPLETVFTGRVGGEPVTHAIDVRWTRPAPPPADLRLVVEGIDGYAPSGRGFEASPHFSTRVEATPLGPRVHLTLSPQHPEGRLAARVHCTFRGRPLELYARGDMFRGIAVDPVWVSFSRVEWWKDEAQFLREIRLSSTDGKPFDISELRSQLTRSNTAGLALAIESSPLEGGRVQVLKVRLSIPAASVPQGTFSGTITVATTCPEKPLLEIPISGFLAKPRDPVTPRR